jgi:site-specific DNA recombinase
MERGKSQPRRCAIYTRKSSEEGLEQDFNSLHAQREACIMDVRRKAIRQWRPMKWLKCFPFQRASRPS